MQPDEKPVQDFESILREEQRKEEEALAQLKKDEELARE
jgi:hypothetical protein